MILLFVGAGGSAAVDAEQYPTTIEFFNRLPTDITNDPMFTTVQEFLRTKKEDGQPIDIEEILWELDNIQNYLTLSSNSDTIGGWCMMNNLFAQFSNVAVRPDGFPSALEGIIDSYVEPLRNRIYDLVHDFYAEPLDTNQNNGFTIWIQLLQQLQQLDPLIEIFTTNYDLVLERVIREADIKVATGRSHDGIQTTLKSTEWNDLIDTNGKGRLTKLHGSVDWQRRNGDIICSPVYTGSSRHHAILYPGLKEEPRDSPFDKFHNYLQAVVSRPPVTAIFVGFAFRDNYINGILSYLSPGTQKIIVNKDSSKPDVPFQGGTYTHLDEGLTEKTARHCISLVRNQVHGH